MVSVKVSVLEDMDGFSEFLLSDDVKNSRVVIEGNSTTQQTLQGLVWSREGLQYNSGKSGFKPIQFSFDEYFHSWQKQSFGKNSSLLIKALKEDRNIIDCSCGTGKDASQMLYQGLEVDAFEREPHIYLLLSFAKHCSTHPFVAKLNLHFGDAFSCLHQFESTKIDALYYDPMFSTGKTKSLPRKEMQIFRDLDQCIEKGLLNEMEQKKQALSIASKVVVKRSLRQDYLWGKPSYQLLGKTIRMDVYR